MMGRVINLHSLRACPLVTVLTNLDSLDDFLIFTVLSIWVLSHGVDSAINYDDGERYIS